MINGIIAALGKVAEEGARRFASSSMLWQFQHVEGLIFDCTINSTGVLTIIFKPKGSRDEVIEELRQLVDPRMFSFNAIDGERIMAQRSLATQPARPAAA